MGKIERVYENKKRINKNKLYVQNIVNVQKINFVYTKEKNKLGIIQK